MSPGRGRGPGRGERALPSLGEAWPRRPRLSQVAASEARQRTTRQLQLLSFPSTCLGDRSRLLLAPSLNPSGSSNCCFIDSAQRRNQASL